MIANACLTGCGSNTTTDVWPHEHLCEICWMILHSMHAHQLTRGVNVVEAAVDYSKRWPPEQRRRAEAACRLGGNDLDMVAALGEPTS